jgi:hypothetical protein
VSLLPSTSCCISQYFCSFRSFVVLLGAAFTYVVRGALVAFSLPVLASQPVVAEISPWSRGVFGQRAMWVTSAGTGVRETPYVGFVQVVKLLIGKLYCDQPVPFFLPFRGRQLL